MIQPHPQGHHVRFASGERLGAGPEGCHFEPSLALRGQPVAGDLSVDGRWDDGDFRWKIPRKYGEMEIFDNI